MEKQGHFECDPPEDACGLKRFGYSRDSRNEVEADCQRQPEGRAEPVNRPDCVQVVIALIVTPEGLPAAYEVMPGNTSDKTTLPDFLRKTEKQYGRMNRLWIMDRGIPTEDALEKFKAMQMIDVHLPTTDGRNLVLPRYTQPEKDIQLLLHQLNLTLPEQPPPRLEELKKKCRADL